MPTRSRSGGRCRAAESCRRLAVRPFTQKLWQEQDRHLGDRLRLFAAVQAWIGVSNALYPGSFVDVAASFLIPSVTYLDSDPRAKRFFEDIEGVDEIISRHSTDAAARSWRFVGADYTTETGLPRAGFDLLISLYAGFVSEHCTRYLRSGGWLLVNPSHGDAALTSLDPRYQLVAVVVSRSGNYSISDRDLDSYLIPKRGDNVTAGLVHRTGRGVAYTKSPFAYLFRFQTDSRLRAGASVRVDPSIDE